METILYNISQVIGVAVIHSLWQGLFIYCLLRMILMSFSAMSAASKHNIGMLALLGLTTWFLCTLVGEIRIYHWTIIKPNDNNLAYIPSMLAMPLHFPHTTPISSREFYTIESFLPYITLIYFSGLLYNTTRLIVTRTRFAELKQHISIDIAILRKINAFASQFDIERRISFGLSTLVDVPCVFGYIKPFILLPAAIATSLSTEEIEAILLHELAHIKRNDYLLNLIQQAMQVLLFFNPFAHLIGRSINSERENACDDMVIASTQKPIVYAHALLKLEQTRTHLGQLALAATGKKYHLLNRIERIMKTKKPIGNVRHILLAFVVLTASITGLAWLNPGIAHGKISFNKIKPAIINSFLTDTGRKKTTSKEKQKLAYKQKRAAEFSNDTSKMTFADDAKMKKYQAEMEKYGEEMSKYYNSGQWKKFQEQMEIDGKKMEEYYNSPEWKKLQEQIEAESKKIEEYYNSAAWKEMEANQQKMAEEFQSKWAETPETKALSANMEKIGKDMEHYYNSPEFKTLNNNLLKKYGVPKNYQYDYKNNGANNSKANQNYLKYQEELQNQLPARIKEETEELKRSGEKLSQHFNSPEFREKSEELRKISDSISRMANKEAIKNAQEKMKVLNEQMRAYQNGPELKKIQDEMRQAGINMKKYQNSPELKKLQADMRLAQKKMQEYFNSPEFKKQMEEIKNLKGNVEPFKENQAPADKPDTSGKN